jgi:hypothetical protein
MSEREPPGYPPDTEKLFNVLWEQVCTFSAKWKLYLDLFSTEANKKVVNETAPGAFMLIEHSLRNDMVMVISRLTDPQVMGGRSNLSLEHLIEELNTHCPAGMYDQLKADLAEIRNHVTPFKLIRNRKIGHIDMPTALSNVPDPSLGVNRPHVDQALTLICNLMNSISTHFADTTHAFKKVVMHGNGEHLIFYLNAALERFEEEKRRALELACP